MSPTQRGLRDDLIRLGTEPTPAPSPAFTARLERQLVSSVGGPAGATVLPLRRRQRRLVPVLTLAAATVAAIVLGGALLGVFGHGGSSSLQLGNAKDTTVVFPGGQTVTGHNGLGLPDGSVVRTGPNGRAAAGSVQLGPSGAGVVDAGRLQPLPPPSLPTVTTPTPPVQVPTLPTLPTLPNLPQLPAPPGGH